MNPLIRLLAPTECPHELLLLADPSSEHISRYISRSMIFGVQEGEQVLAVAVMTPTGEGVVEIMNIAVAESRQNAGWGSALLRECIRHAREEKFRRLEIGTGNSSILQLRLYQKIGFRIVGVDPDYFVNHYPEPIFENGIQCRDMIRLALDLS